MDDLKTIPRGRAASVSKSKGGLPALTGSKALRIHSARLDIGQQRQAAEVLITRSGTVWFDYTDLIHYFEDNRVPTGIQRVQIGMFRASLARDSGNPSGRICACSFDTVRRCWVPVPEALLASVCRAACHAGGGASGGDDDAWQTLTAALRQAIATSPAVPFSTGDVLVNIGTSWWIPDYLSYVQYLQRERGVLYAPFMHDCIPLRMPETCSAGLVEDFEAWFHEAMRMADLVLANSEHTARDVAAFAKAKTGYPAEPHVVRLDARFDDGPQPGPVASARLDAITHARLAIHRPFALFVATIEARKNHIFVFQCWQALIERHGDAVPDLICVGKQGWLVEYTLNWLRVHPQLAHRIRLVGTQSDLDLAALYRTAEFSVYCSHYEGWGLPVTESLCHGRVPIVPNHSSLPEAGGPFAIYYEPESRAGFCAAVEQVMDRATRSDLEGKIRARFKPRVWSDVLWQLIETVRHVPTRPRALPIRMEPGCLYTFARRQQNAPQAAGRVSGHALKHGLGWHEAEDWGCWSRLAQAQVLLTMPDQTGVDQLYLVLRGGPRDQTIDVQAGGAAVAFPAALRAGQRRLVRVPLSPGPGQEVLVTLSVAPYSLGPFTGGGDQREIGCGLEALAIADRCDAVARLDLLDFLLDAG